MSKVSAEFDKWWDENGYLPIVPAPVYQALKENCFKAVIESVRKDMIKGRCKDCYYNKGKARCRLPIDCGIKYCSEFTPVSDSEPKQGEEVR